MTDSGRTVYGGGGITPDEKYLPPPMDRLEASLYRDGLFNFTRSYFAKHTNPLPKGWMPNEAIVTDLHDYLLDKKVSFTEVDFTKDHDWIKRYLTSEMYTYAFNVDESDRVFAQTRSGSGAGGGSNAQGGFLAARRPKGDWPAHGAGPKAPSRPLRRPGTRVCIRHLRSSSWTRADNTAT